MKHSTAGQLIRPDKPRSDFPLFPHATGRWAKKIRGKLHYFGPWSNPDAALNRYLDQKDDLHAGRKPRVGREGLDLRDLTNHFLTAKKRKVEAGEMQQRTWLEYHESCGHVLAIFGKTRLVEDLRSEDFGQLRAHYAKTRGPEALGNQVQRTRSLFKYAYDADLIERPVKFGPEFKAPDKTAKRKARQARPPRMFQPKEIRDQLKIASAQMEAMIYLGINAGFGNGDCSALPKSAIDFRTGILDFSRPKTAIERRVTLWPETLKALKAAIKVRTTPADPADDRLVFLTRFGHPWTRFRTSERSPNGCRTDSVTLEFGKLLAELQIERQGVGFYALRHTFETVAGETGDQAAVDRIMGHSCGDMASHYREWLKDERENARLKKVTDHVRSWLFAKPKTKRDPKLKLAREKIA